MGTGEKNFSLVLNDQESVESFIIHSTKSFKQITKMKSATFRSMNYCDLIIAIIMLVSVLLFASVYMIMTSIAPEIQEASNFDISSWMILIIIVVQIIFVLFFAISTVQWFDLSNPSSKMVQELLYILGIWRLEEDEEKREKLLPSLQATPLDTMKDQYGDTDSIESIYGFGHDENQKWTYAGKKPQVSKTADEKTDAIVNENSEKNKATHDEN